ncbi:hypothetical protein Zm00014a_000880 [Zea mays]|uniref:Uncharacterized protein n=1 Tax=Zea mays TaxID=4577 RepID=A0A317Y8R6_MAIZE|nr:hypothetical protein Zm00014a_004087 [Zea mays]PWZ54646.1 hypothetical protein Zm00014a_000880 [Zea mays]
MLTLLINEFFLLPLHLQLRRGLQGQGWCQGPVRRGRHQQLYLPAPHLWEIFSPIIADNITQALMFLSHFIRDIH